MNDRIYIVAGNYEEFRQYRNKKIGTPATKRFSDYVYVQHVDQLRGLGSIKGFFIGSYEKRDDIDEIKLQIDIIKSKHKSSYIVQLDGIVVDPKDYSINELRGKKITYVNLSFTQAPPAGSHLIITNKDGIMISRMVLDDRDNPNNITNNFHYEFLEVTR